MIKLWYSHKHRQYTTKRINLKKVPEKYRCPACGKILVKPKDRKGYQVKIPKNKRVKVEDYPNDERYDWYVKRGFTERFIPDGYILGHANTKDDFFERNLELGMHGGVCQKCWLSGLGKYGRVGDFFRLNMSETEVSAILGTRNVIKEVIK